MKISHTGEWIDAPVAVIPCQAFAGVCPKPEVTFGEGHQCSLTAGHTGEHRCVRCGMEYNAGSVLEWVIREREDEFRQEKPRD
jgi:hypothetical protein